MFKCEWFQKQKPRVDCYIAEAELTISLTTQSIFYISKLIGKCNVCLNALLTLSISESVFYGHLGCRFDSQPNLWLATLLSSLIARRTSDSMTVLT